MLETIINYATKIKSTFWIQWNYPITIRCSKNKMLTNVELITLKPSKVSNSPKSPPNAS